MGTNKWGWICEYSFLLKSSFLPMQFGKRTLLSGESLRLFYLPLLIMRASGGKRELPFVLSLLQCALQDSGVTMLLCFDLHEAYCYVAGSSEYAQWR